MFLRFCIPASLSILLLSVSNLPASTAAPIGSPPDKAAMDDASLSLVPKSLPLPPELLLGSQIPKSDFAEGRLLEGALKAEPLAPMMDLLGEIGRILDVSDVDWPLGTVTTGHFQWMPGDGLHEWVPFFSVLQETDEIDAHVRNGAGLGVTYRFNPNARIDLEGQFLQRSGDPNPVLHSEERVALMFTFTF